VRWIRVLLKDLADEGRTVLLSSHLMSEMAMTAEHLIVIGRGKLIRDMSVTDFIASASDSAVLVRTPDEQGLRDAVLREGVAVTRTEPGRLKVSGLTSDEIGYRAAAAGLTLLELSPIEASLEDAFMALTHDSVDYRTPTHGMSTNHAPALERTAA
jgi:ABC-2 type transport system ATP-binding protein